MKQPTTIVLSAVVAVTAGAASAFFVPNGVSEVASDQAAEEETDLAELRQQLAAAVETQTQLHAEIERLESQASPAGATRTTVGGIDAAVARWMEANIEGRLQSGVSTVTVASSFSEQKANAERFAQQLLDGDLPRADERRLWMKINEDGLLDFVVAEIERQSEIDPSNPDLQNKLGESYLQQTFAAGVGPASMEWGEKADAAFDRALEVDEEHWEARFNKAVSLSNWPVFLGKSGEAIRQFEILVDQQERKDTPRGGFDRTYYFLGNMYQQIGKRDKAKATWARGAQLFPDSEPLQTQLANN